ncbi:MAG: ribosome silencing factor [Gammaproteobacteria bacterium]|nr:ribosome silencing factor [Gammaproteobacteria bacterium]MDH3380321.1 ribosome silencing factor [Gammaproteobacteria bacterium]
MQSEKLKELAVQALEDAKGRDVRVLDVHGMTDITDFMIIASGTSDRHVRALAEHVREHLRKHKVRPLGTEGDQGGEWMLIDFGDVVVHVMHPQAREFYALERLWSDEVRELVRLNREGQLD